VIPFRPSLIALDLDGTLLSEGRLTPGALPSAVDRLGAAGIPVTIVTGRMYASAREFAEILGIRHPIVTLNGTVCRLEDEMVLHENTLDQAFAESVFNDLPEEVEGYVLKHDHIYHLPDVKRRASLDFFGGGGNYRAVGNLYETFEKGVHQIHLTGDREKLDNFSDFIRTRIPAGWEVFSYPAIIHDWWHMEVRPSGDDKGTGLRVVCAHFGIEPCTALVFGDWLNDIPMFREAGHAVAVANAIEAVHEAADEVLPHSNTEQGVEIYLTQLIEHFGL
jgi:Cof subfamily protein (haloacid dehalogenase superfamily)